MNPTDPRLTRLLDVLRGCESALVAFSGGVDSALVLRAAVDALGPRVLAVTGRSAAVPPREIEEAVRLAASMGAAHRVLDTDELSVPGYRANGADRCYHCKSELFDKLEAVRAAEGLACMVDGTNADDLGDHRPGMRARAERAVRSPLVEAGLGKEDVRALSRGYGLSTAEKPASPCLSSRLPYGTPVTPEALAQVGAAEEAVRALGFREFRVRHHGDVARLEVAPAELERALEPETRARVASALRACGYRYAAVDLDGYRSGSLNEVLPAAIRRASTRTTGEVR